MSTSSAATTSRLVASVTSLTTSGVGWLFADFANVDGCAVLLGHLLALLLGHVLAFLSWHVLALLAGLLGAGLSWHFGAGLENEIKTLYLIFIAEHFTKIYEVSVNFLFLV